MRRLFNHFLRRDRPALAAAGGLVLMLGTTHGCDVDDKACQRSRTCVPGSGAIGVESRLSGGRASADGVAPGGAAGEGGAGLGGDGLGGAASPATTHSEGETCAPNGVYACAAHAKRMQLVCIDGTFAPYGICKTTERCDTRPETEGLCQPLVPECFDHHDGDVVCRGAERLMCGVDLVTAEHLDSCAGGCVDGTCTECAPDVAPTCEHNSRRSCTAAGDWDVTACPAETPHCSHGECGAPPSCQNLSENCGKDWDEPCCTSPLVTGGHFDRNNDPALPATISSFRLDRFEVTVGRFRQFKKAWDAGWRPDGGSGKHVHLNGGLGLVDAGQPGGFEVGWKDTYLSTAGPTDDTLDGSPNQPIATWTPISSDNETRPINQITYSEAYAFCIWDEGFLPSDSEWSYAGSGGAEQRDYPWGSDVPGANFDLAVYGCFFPTAGPCTSYQNVAQAGVAQGEGLFGQLDLAGNIAEWTAGDVSGSPCVDCVAFPVSDLVATSRGGTFLNENDRLLNSSAPTQGSGNRAMTLGVRCARAP